MRYWIDLFTWTTWQEFLQAGGRVSGFKESRWRTVEKMQPGDLLLCYLTGISRFFAILEVIGKPYKDNSPIWHEMSFPARIPVRIVLDLPPEYAVPVKSLKSKLSYFLEAKTPHSWTGHFRGSPTEEKPKDAQVIIDALEEAAANPEYREYDPKKLERAVPLYSSEEGLVTVPENDEDISLRADKSNGFTHDEMQWFLLELGSNMGLDVWVARNDKSRSYQGNQFHAIRRMRQKLPAQFDSATNRTIELIDVLWLRENAIVAAFEIEHTSSIYSGLLRMSDLISMQPNINIRLYIVAPDERREKVLSEINRPTFSKLKPPLKEICQFIPYTALKDAVEKYRAVLKHLNPEFLDEIAEETDQADLYND